MQNDGRVLVVIKANVRTKTPENLNHGGLFKEILYSVFVFIFYLLTS